MPLLCNSTGNSSISNDFLSAAVTLSTLFWSIVSNLKGNFEKSVIDKPQDFLLKKENMRVSFSQVEAVLTESNNRIYYSKNETNLQRDTLDFLPKVHFELPNSSLWSKITDDLEKEEMNLYYNNVNARTKNIVSERNSILSVTNNFKFVTKQKTESNFKKLLSRRRRSYSVSDNLEGVFRRKQLYCRTGFHLQILPSGRVAGTSQDHDRHAILEFISVDVGLITIRGVDSGKYLSMDNKGRLYGSDIITSESVFLETLLENWYNSYSVYRKRNGISAKVCYVALSKNGKVRPGCRPNVNQKLTHFLPRPVDPEKVPDLYKGILY